MTLHIDLAKAQELISQAVAERGEEYKYSNPHADWENVNYRVDTYASSDGSNGPNCLYIHKDVNGDITPGCGVGLALINAGIPKEWFDGVEENSSTVHDKLRELNNCDKLTYTSDAADYLRYFQAEQDYGTSWGACKAYADRSISE